MKGLKAMPIFALQCMSNIVHSSQANSDETCMPYTMPEGTWCVAVVVGDSKSLRGLWLLFPQETTQRPHFDNLSYRFSKL